MKVEAGRKIFGDTNRLSRTQELGCSPSVFSLTCNNSTEGIAMFLDYRRGATTAPGRNGAHQKDFDEP